ncbi:hypothetical protein [Candidatus Thiosymbion oneisti]|uniref:hypothetical protein n=1 Tax=Candidatus Thiosymbion oneisti TaxID=589554 RepID=UPI0013FD5547|nr:hypothetical protein [Candidatus Thiosymbion oneisti]
MKEEYQWGVGCGEARRRPDAGTRRELGRTTLMDGGVPDKILAEDQSANERE